MRAILRPRLRYQAAIEATAIGLTLGLIDVHSTNEDSFNPVAANFLAGLVLGLRYAGRAWQAWIPLGGCFYLMHRAAIARGYRPPYVEPDAETALLSFIMLWPAGFGLALGASVRFAIRHVTGVARSARERVVSPSESAPDARTPRPRLTVRRLMAIVALIAIHLAFVRVLLNIDPFFGFGTIYAERFSERRFGTIRVGMTPGEVEAIVGRPLRKVPWDDPGAPTGKEMWYYSDQFHYTFNYWRRWVLFEKGKVLVVINDFWLD